MRPASIAIGLLCAVGFGCAERPLTLDAQPRAFDEDSYQDVYRAWTRSKETFSWLKLQHLLRVTATFESWEFRWAYSLRYAHDHSLGKATEEEMLQASLSRARQEHRFYVSLVGDSLRESNLAGRRSAWRILLVASDGRQAEPIALERIRRPTPAEIVYFPSTSSQREVFRVTFPATDQHGRALLASEDDHLLLRLTGPRGKVELRWDLVPDVRDRALSWHQSVLSDG